ncbi:peroxiredoxin Q/BCP [Cohaesibacter sp. ES.047]|uniref:thioredoxin-dependent thiol peroxidase n=1 Tax=Cohaesibacter sp. ES.047 TaxID=1798205 RepID=UPI000BB84AE9|nr:thioredoxin-dependent thiol peroxidase [Cohaesibacter sp. ES.047]SNY93779.1 peroxiredoxin Q/BCP [Cohaesibacter sp. ES.047]
MTDKATVLEQGDTAPDFSLPTNGSGTVTLSALQGNPVVVYFYPKDNTPGCTTEALDFSALKDEFASLDTTIIGISPDSVKKHDNFVAKHDLTILLASDEDTSTCEAYGIWGEKKMYGKTFMGVERSTFLIDKEGKIAKVWRKVKVKNHASDVLDAVRTLDK